MYWGPKVSMTKHSKSQEGKSDWLGEEHPANICWNICKCISYTSNHDILKPGCLLDKRISLDLTGKEMVSNESPGQLDDYKIVREN